MTNYENSAKEARDRLNAISPSMCMAKWLQVSLHLPQGRTHSCYHPPTHPIPLAELQATPNALHNTQFKMQERKQMLEGERPSGCQYCWNVEDAPNPPEGGRLSDRHYRSSEWWTKDAWDEVINNPWDHNITPRYVEVNFNQACNFKCSYCSPHLSTAWEDDVKKHGPFYFSTGSGHNDINSLRNSELMPLELARKDNPYVDAFWKWFPDVYPNLKVFRMTGGEPLMDKNTFKIFDHIKQNPNPNLELSLTTNICPPDDSLFDKFLNHIKELEMPIWDSAKEVNDKINIEIYKQYDKESTSRRLLFYVEDMKNGEWKTWPRKIISETLQGSDKLDFFIDDESIKFSEIKQKFSHLGKCDDNDDNSFIYDLTYIKKGNTWRQVSSNTYVKHISIFVSLDSIGKQAEYIRDGLNFEKLKANVNRILNETNRVSITFINTFNILSIPNLRGFLEYILELRSEFGYESQTLKKLNNKAQRIWFDIPYLRYPDWMTIQLADNELLETIEKNIKFMKENVLPDDVYGRTYQGFKNYEVLKLERDLSWAKGKASTPGSFIRFYEYFTEYDRRRGLNFLEVFPEMENFWNNVKELKESNE